MGKEKVGGLIMGYGFNADKSKHQYNTETRTFNGGNYSTFAEFLLDIYNYIKDSVFNAEFDISGQGWEPVTIAYGKGTGEGSAQVFRIKLNTCRGNGNYLSIETWSIVYNTIPPSLTPTPAEYCRAYTMQFPTTSGENVKGTVTTRTTPTDQFEVRITRFTP